jgi:hypothetical protein
MSAPSPPPLARTWLDAWPEALARWSAFTQLRPPRFFESDADDGPEGLAGQIAAIRLRDQSVLVNLATIRARGLEDLALPILAHEIGHHIYVPANLADNARLLVAIRPVLFNLPADTHHMVANLYADLLLNDRLQRSAGVNVAEVYRRLAASTPWDNTSHTWRLYVRTYEVLWRLPAGTLAGGDIPAEMNADAALLARLVRHYAGNWLAGARRFALILFTYLHDDLQHNRADTLTGLGLSDLRQAGQGGWPDGLTQFGPEELDEDDSFDRELQGLDGDPEQPLEPPERNRDLPTPPNTEPLDETQRRSTVQHREPIAYGELIRALGLDLSEHEITTRYYRERALPHLIPFPDRRTQRALEPLAEGYEPWHADEDLDDLDLFGSVLRSPILVPGVTTVQRVYGMVPGPEPGRVPLDLDIYVDCSGSMPNPALSVSYLALAGTILALSALRRGASVQATLWSGPNQFETTGGFLRDERRILGIITGYISGSTAFPLHVLRDTYASRKPDDPPAHIVVISDDGVDTILGMDERGTRGEELCRAALEAARGGGTLVLNLPRVEGWKPGESLRELGFAIHAVGYWAQLIEFARAFVRANYRE